VSEEIGGAEYSGILLRIVGGWAYSTADLFFLPWAVVFVRGRPASCAACGTVWRRFEDALVLSLRLEKKF